MAKEINLLPDITLNEERDSKRQKLITIVSMLILVIGTVALLGAFTYHSIIVQEYNKVLEENKQLQTQILVYSLTEQTQRGLKSKIVTASKIVNAAKDYKKLIEDMQGLTPQEGGIAINSIDIDKANNININGKANNSRSFEIYFKNLTTEGSKLFTNIQASNTSIGVDGSVQFTVSMELIKKGGTAK